MSSCLKTKFDTCPSGRVAFHRTMSAFPFLWWVVSLGLVCPSSGLQLSRKFGLQSNGAFRDFRRDEISERESGFQQWVNNLVDDIDVSYYGLSDGDVGGEETYISRRKSIRKQEEYNVSKKSSSRYQVLGMLPPIGGDDPNEDVVASHPNRDPYGNPLMRGLIRIREDFIAPTFIDLRKAWFFRRTTSSSRTVAVADSSRSPDLEPDGVTGDATGKTFGGPTRAPTYGDPCLAVGGRTGDTGTPQPMVCGREQSKSSTLSSGTASTDDGSARSSAAIPVVPEATARHSPSTRRSPTTPTRQPVYRDVLTNRGQKLTRKLVRSTSPKSFPVAGGLTLRRQSSSLASAVRTSSSSRMGNGMEVVVTARSSFLGMCVDGGASCCQSYLEAIQPEFILKSPAMTAGNGGVVSGPSCESPRDVDESSRDIPSDERLGRERVPHSGFSLNRNPRRRDRPAGLLTVPPCCVRPKVLNVGTGFSLIAAEMMVMNFLY